MQKDFKEWVSSLGRSKDKEVEVNAGAVALFDKAGKGLAAPDDESPDRPGYDGLQSMLAEPLRKGSDIIQMSVSEAGAAVRYSVDGMPYEGSNSAPPRQAGRYC